MSDQGSEHYLRMEVKGVAKNIHEKFPITFNYGEASGIAYFNGCRVEALEARGDKTFTNRMDVQAFGEVAEALVGVSEGSVIHAFGSYGQRKGKDDKYYPIVTLDEIISVD